MRRTSGHISYVDEGHQFRANTSADLSKRQSDNNVQLQQHQQHESHNSQKKKQIATQITSSRDPVDGFAYDERDHSFTNRFIIIPAPLKRRHNKKFGAPTIYFPEPPASEPSLPPSPSQSHKYGTLSSDGASGSSNSSGTSTSDTSSIYYIKTHKGQRHPLYAKRPKRISAVNHREYATITKKQIERAQKRSKHKHRKYLAGVASGNRVGASESAMVQVHSSAVEAQRNANAEFQRVRSSLDDNFEVSIGKDSNLYEHIEAFNPLVGKKDVRNQIIIAEQQTDVGNKSTRISDENEKHMRNKSHLIDKQQNGNDNDEQSRNGTAGDSPQQPKHKLKKPSSSNEVVVIAATQPPSTIKTRNASNLSDESNKMAKIDCVPKRLSAEELHDDDDVGSVGSFLSMTSVRSFPKCNVPESLNRVLEPVSITYLDQYDEIEATEAATMASKLPRIVDARTKKSSAPSKSQTKLQPQPPTPPARSCKQHGYTEAKQNCDEVVYLSRTRSDGADPGVIGPIAWQYHKKRLEDQRK